MSAPWPTLQFDEAVEDASGGNIKTKQNDYAEVGEFPIVDQGKALIAGYTDDEAALCKVPLPVVIFGDHTRCLKFVDFPFGMGADGVKVLKPKAGLDAKFLYHYLRQIKLPDGGYDRHFKYLKRETVPLPPLEEQRRIAAILDQAETLRTQRRTALALLDSLTQSLFLDMFGDPMTNPKKLPLFRGDEICSRITVGIVVQPSSYYRSEGVPALRSLNIRPNKVVMENLVYFSSEDNETKLAKTRVRQGDVLLVRTGQPGTAAVVPPELDGVNAIDILIATPDTSKVSADYLCYFFNSDAGKKLVLGAQRGQVQKHLNVGAMNAALIPIPPLPLQQTFATRIASIEALKATHRRALAALDALFASLQQRAFAGQL